MTTITNIPLEKLRFGHELPGGGINSRTTGRDAEIKELAASIEHEGLLLPLIVVKGTDKKTAGCYFAIDGNRRLAALKSLGWTDIECKVVDCVTEAEALSKSLAANGHVPLHPADRAETFAKLNKDKPAEQIAEQYGMTVRAVQQAIALGGTLASEILNLWRTGEIKRPVVEVFTLTDNQDDQLAALEWLKTQWKWNDGREQTLTELRRKLMRNKEPEMKRLLGFVGVDAYRAAGGVVAEDFFGQGGNVKDMKLLHKLAKKKMDELIAAAQADGWSWAEGRMKPNHMHHGYGEMKVKEPDYLAVEHDRLTAIEARLAVLTAIDEQSDADIDEQEQLKAEQTVIESAAKTRGFTDKQKAKGGVIIALTNEGAIQYTAGLIRREGEDKKAKPKQGGPANYAQRAPEPIDWRARNAIGDWQDDAAAELLFLHPHEALAALLASVGSGVMGNDEPFRLNKMERVPRVAKAKGFIASYHELKALSIKDLAMMMGRVAADCVDIGDHQGKIKKSVQPILELIGEKAYQALVAKKFDPKIYFGGASKQHILGCIREALGEDARKAAESKNEEAIRKDAIASIGKTGWLPPELRTCHYAKPVPPKASVTAIEPKKAKATKPTPKKKAA